MWREYNPSNQTGWGAYSWENKKVEGDAIQAKPKTKAASFINMINSQSWIGGDGCGDETSGVIGSGSTGRSDSYAYSDGIYVGQIEDLRLNSNKPNKHELLEDGVSRSIAGETRGNGSVPFTKSVKITPDNAQNGNMLWTGYNNTGLDSNSGWIALGEPQQSYPNLKVGMPIYAYDGTQIIKAKIASYDFGKTLKYVRVIFDQEWWDANSVTSIPANDNDTYSIIIQDMNESYDVMPYVDIIAYPDKLANVFPNGVIGEWNTHLPEDSETRAELNRPSSGGIRFVKPEGSNWSSYSDGYDSTKNDVYVSASESTVSLYFYESSSDFTKSDTSRTVIGDIGDVYASNGWRVEYGNRLSPSLVGVFNKTDGWSSTHRNYKLLQFGMGSGGEMSSSLDNTHTTIDLVGSDGESALKALPHLVELDGLLYIQWRATQLVYDDDSFLPWGDDSRIDIVNGNQTKTDLNEHTVKVVTHTELMPLGIYNQNDTL